MDRIWVLAETAGGQPAAAALELLTVARGFAASVEAFSYGQDAAAVAASLGDYGALKVYDAGDLGGALPGPAMAAVMAGLIESGEVPEAIFLPTSYDGRDTAGRLSARLDLPVITNIVGFEAGADGIVTEHAVFGGEKVVRARFTGKGPGIYVVRAKAVAAEPCGGPPAVVVPMEVPDLGAVGAARIVASHAEERSGPKLDEASVVVSGGRGLGGKEGYAMIEELAKLLGGAAGASRAIVDAGWVPYSHQVGQTGKTVKPTVYIACGISGATQHMVGMKGAKNIIAINKDRDAPIFSIADLGVVGDVNKVVPALIASIKARS